jgi:pseudouridine kinase
LVNAGVNIVMITLGEAGVIYATANASGHVPAVATQLVDLTGASDALTATVVFGLLNEIPLDEAVRLGASAAALTLECTDTVCQDLSLDLLYDQLLI